MKPIYEFIVEIKQSHKDNVALKGGLTLKVDTKYNQGMYTNRIGKVVATPVKFDSRIKKDYIVLIDKNLITYQVHDDNLINKSVFLIDAEKGYYRVPANMIYLYKENEQADWICPSPFIFIKPIKVEDTITESNLLIKEKNYKGNKEQYGTIQILNDYAVELGMKVGDEVYYPKDREYEFEIDGEILYHMENKDILALVE